MSLPAIDITIKNKTPTQAFTPPVEKMGTM